MRYKPHEPRPKTSGRKKGSTNKASPELKHWCQYLISNPAYRAQFEAKFIAGKLDPQLERNVWYYAAGKPREEQHITGSFGPLVTIITKGVPSLSDPGPKS